MGTVYKETFTKPLPPEAEIFARQGQRFARWKDAKGKTRAARVTTPTTGPHAGVDRVIVESSHYTAKYRDGSGIIRKVATGCRTLDAARAVLVELEGRADKVRSKIRSADEDRVADYLLVPLRQHLEEYLNHQRAKGLNPERIKTTGRRVERVAAECHFDRLSDVTAVTVERWLVDQQGRGMSPANRNEYRQAMIGFCNWCVRNHRMASSPVVQVTRADAKVDRRRQRRALTDDELRRLLQVARLRPLAEYGRQSAKLPSEQIQGRGRRTWTKAPLTLDTLEAAAQRGREALGQRPDFIAKLERTGHERALIYKTLVLTGLRRGELASLTVGQLELDPTNGAVAYAVLHPADEKNRQGSEIAIRVDLAADLRRWLAHRLEAVRAEAKAAGGPVPVRLPHDAPLFNVPTGLVRILDRDLATAGIPKRDERGRTVDVHALRHTFGTHLSKGGIAPRTAQAAMRHSSIDLTMNVYTDPKLLDVAGALAALPSLPLEKSPARETRRATGTSPSALVPVLVPTSGFAGPSVSSRDRNLAGIAHRDSDDPFSLSAGSVNSKTPADVCRQRVSLVEPTGIEPVTSTLRT